MCPSLFFRLSVCYYVSLSYNLTPVCILFYLPISSSISQSVIKSACMSLHASVCHNICQFVIIYVCMSSYVSVYRPMSLFVMLCLFVILWFYLSFNSFSGYQSVCHLPDVLLLSLSVYCSFCYSVSIIDGKNDKTDRESSRMVDIIYLFFNLSFCLFLSIHVPRLTRS